MIDTVILRIDAAQFKIFPSKYDSFTPSARPIFEPPYYSFGKTKAIKCHLNPNADDRRKGTYLPRLTLVKAVRAGGYAIFLLVEFSAPKILFNNNFDELDDGDFEKLCEKIAHDLRHIGIIIRDKAIINAEVKTIHYGKNIVIDDYCTVSSVIGEISKFNVSTRKNADVRDYKNDGESTRFFTNSNALVFYDKLKEIRKARTTEKGLNEKDYYCQLDLFEFYRTRKPFEVLRVEARYSTKKAIMKVMEESKVQLPEKPVFKDFFKKEIAQKVLLCEISQLRRNDFSFADSKKKGVMEFANDLKINNPNVSPSVLLKAIAVKSIMMETGCRNIPNIIGLNNSQKSRLKNEMMQLQYERKTNSAIERINHALNEFKTIKLKDYKPNMKGIDI